MTSYEGNDIYCDLIIPGKIEIAVVEETENVLAFHHTRPHWPVHIVVIPKQHIDSLLDLNNQDGIAGELLEVVQHVASKVTEQEGACRVLTNIGDYQKSKHLHVLVISGEAKSDNIV